jgi:hypothetical protein
MISTRRYFDFVANVDWERQAGPLGLGAPMAAFYARGQAREARSPREAARLLNEAGRPVAPTKAGTAGLPPRQAGRLIAPTKAGTAGLPPRQAGRLIAPMKAGTAGLPPRQAVPGKALLVVEPSAGLGAALDEAPLDWRAVRRKPAPRRPLWPAGDAPSRSAPGVDILRDADPNRVRAVVRAATDGYLYVADGYSRHWRARVSGREAPVLPANLAFKAVEVPRGEHEVVLEYDPASYRRALYLWAAGTALAMAVLGAGALRKTA